MPRFRKHRGSLADSLEMIKKILPGRAVVRSSDGHRYPQSVSDSVDGILTSDGHVIKAGSVLVIAASNVNEGDFVMGLIGTGELVGFAGTSLPGTHMVVVPEARWRSTSKQGAIAKIQMGRGAFMYYTRPNGQVVPGNNLPEDVWKILREERRALSVPAATAERDLRALGALRQSLASVPLGGGNPEAALRDRWLVELDAAVATIELATGIEPASS